MDKRKAVFVLGVEPRITVPVARSLHEFGIPVFVAGISSTDPVLHSRSLAGTFRLPCPMESPNDFLNGISAKVKSTGADMLIPVTDGALSAISRHYESLKSLLHVACPPPAVVDRVLNKQATLRIATGLGIRVPHEYAFFSRTSSGTVPEVRFPVIAKPKEKRAAEAFKIRYFFTEAELLDALNKGVLDDAVVQEYCAGDGVGVEMLIHQGNCVAAFQHRRLSEFPDSGGVAVKAIAEPLDSQLADSSLKLLRGLEWEGVAMVEFRHDRKTGVAALMEVNGRYWGTISLPIQAGINFPVYQWQVAHGEAPSVPSSYEVGATWRWSAGCLKRWHGVLTSRNRLALENVEPNSAPAPGKKRDALWTRQDPLPAVFEWLNTAKTLLRSDARAIVKRILPKRMLASLQRRTPPRSRAVQMEPQSTQSRSVLEKRDTRG
jgi:predicted ATP-grasp superfamily ATP-dependent carboligase